jgi:hypothetical protein
MKGKIKYLILLLGIIFSLNIGHAQYLENYFTSLTVIRWDVQILRQKHASEVMQDNEFERNVLTSNIHANPLLLNGKILNYGTFDGNTTGVLTVVKGKPETSEAQVIPFYVYIRRSGKIITNSKMSFLNKKLTKIEISDILKFSQNGDVLIIKPVKTEDWRAKRILKIVNNFGC